METTGVVQSECSTFSIIPIDSNLSSSFSIDSLIAYSTGRALKNLGVVLGLTCNVATMDFSVPRSSLKVSSYFLKKPFLD